MDAGRPAGLLAWLIARVCLGSYDIYSSLPASEPASDSSSIVVVLLCEYSGAGSGAPSGPEPG